MNKVIYIEDIILYIFSYINEEALEKNVQYVNKLFYKYVMIYFCRKYVRKNFLSDYYTGIYPEQSYAIQKIEDIRKQMDEEYTIIYRSPMGTGKTAAALYCALNSPYNTLIVITSRVLSTWLDEIKKFGIYNTDIKKSKVLFVHYAINSDHVRHARLKDTNNQKINHKIVITTEHYTPLIQKIYEKHDIIVDEAHLYKHSIYMRLTLNKEFRGELLLLSASPIKIGKILDEKVYPIICKNITIKKDLIKDRVDVDDITGKYAKISYHYEIIGEEEFGWSYIEKFYHKGYRKIVIFSNYSGKDLIRFANIFSKNASGYYCFAFSNKAKTYMEKFRKRDCIVLCNYMTAIEGVNFSEADCCILHNFHHNSPEKARQCIGRLRRKNNINNNIDIFFVANDKLDDSIKYIKMRLNQIYAFNFNIKEMVKKSERAIGMICKILQENKYNIKKITDIEILLLFSNGKYEFENINFTIDGKLLLTLIYYV